MKLAYLSLFLLFSTIVHAANYMGINVANPVTNGSEAVREVRTLISKLIQKDGLRFRSSQLSRHKNPTLVRHFCIAINDAHLDDTKHKLKDLQNKYEGISTKTKDCRPKADTIEVKVHDVNQSGQLADQAVRNTLINDSFDLTAITKLGVTESKDANGLVTKAYCFAYGKNTLNLTNHLLNLFTPLTHTNKQITVEHKYCQPEVEN